MSPIPSDRRSLSPFGACDATPDPLTGVAAAFSDAFPDADETPRTLRFLSDLPAVPAVMRTVWEAPSGGAPALGPLCDCLIRHLDTLREKGLLEAACEGMFLLFERKTELFLLDRTAPDGGGETVLFARERDLIVGAFFGRVWESAPGRFSEFISRWAASTDMDRIAHLLDFLAGGRNPTFEYYLLFSHPALSRIAGNKPLLRTLQANARPLLDKVASPAWAVDLERRLGLA